MEADTKVVTMAAVEPEAAEQTVEEQGSEE